MRLLARAASALPCALALAACEPMPPSGAPFSPVRAEGPGAADRADDPRFDRPAAKTWTSEELHAAAASTAPEAASGSAGGAVVVSSGAPLGGAAAAPGGGEGSPVGATSGVQASAGATAAPAPSATPPAGTSSAGTSSAGTSSAGTPSAAITGAPTGAVAATPSAWPLRLVRALPDTIPPRAILGLPDGREVVVSPGAMLPEVGVVVMAIGRERLQVARIAAQGDHAAVQELTLSSQY